MCFNLPYIFLIARPSTCILKYLYPRLIGRSLSFKIIFQDFGKIILKNNLEKKSRLFFKILAKIFLDKIVDFTIYLVEACLGEMCALLHSFLLDLVVSTSNPFINSSKNFLLGVGEPRN